MRCTTAAYVENYCSYNSSYIGYLGWVIFRDLFTPIQLQPCLRECSFIVSNHVP